MYWFKNQAQFWIKLKNNAIPQAYWLKISFNYSDLNSYCCLVSSYIFVLMSNRTKTESGRSLKPLFTMSIDPTYRYQISAEFFLEMVGILTCPFSSMCNSNTGNDALLYFNFQWYACLFDSVCMATHVEAEAQTWISSSRTGPAALDTVSFVGLVFSS